MEIPILVEGDTDVPIASKLLQLVDCYVGTVYGLRGKGWLDVQLPRYNRAALFGRWFVLRDLNGDAACAPEFVGRTLSLPSRGMCFRVAVRAAESWLLADRQRIADFLRVPVGRIPVAPDDLENPKQTLVNIARHSRNRGIREELVPELGTSARVGPGYTARMIEFGSATWNPATAAAASPSLSRCIKAVERWAAID